MFENEDFLLVICIVEMMVFCVRVMFVLKKRSEKAFWKLSKPGILSVIKAIMDRKAKFRTAEERNDAAERMKQDMEVLSSYNMGLALTGPLIETRPTDPATAENRVDLLLSYEIFDSIGELLRGEPDMLQLELSTFVQKFPDVSQPQLGRLLDVRGDMRIDFNDWTRNDGFRVQDVMAGELARKKTKTLFSEVTFKATHHFLWKNFKKIFREKNFFVKKFQKIFRKKKFQKNFSAKKSFLWKIFQKFREKNNLVLRICDFDVDVNCVPDVYLLILLGEINDMTHHFLLPFICSVRGMVPYCVRSVFCP